MKTLILGGTGAMGSHLSSLLSGDDSIVYVTTRKKRHNSEHIVYKVGDAHELSFISSLLKKEKWDAVVDFMNYSTTEFAERADFFLESTKHYIFLSSSRVYADSKLPINENCPRLLDVCTDDDYLSTDEYALAKARQENILFKNKRKNWSIIRPYITFSETRLQLSPAEKESWLYRALNGKSIFFSRDLSEKYTTLTYGFDVARGIAAILCKEDAFGEAFHITSNENYKWSDILDNYLSVLASKLGYKPNVIMIDKWDNYIGGSYTQIKWDRLYDRRFDNSKINHFINTKTFRPTMESTAECLSLFIEHPQFGWIDYAEAGNG